MKKIWFLFLLLMSSTFLSYAQQITQIYDEKQDAMQQIASAIEDAHAQNKYVLCQIGGNWCPWCLRFAQFANSDTLVNKIITENFIYIHINWSKNNQNPEAMRYLGNPARFGFPVFVIIDEKGHPIHIQNSAYLEEGKGYSQEKVADFLMHWTPRAVQTLK